ncbi:MAG: VanZ family protein [Demequinaceae bacterium]|nr:VanZ family protein [Demequinaceae bacterium]
MSDFMWRLASTVLPAVAVGTTAVWMTYAIARRGRGAEAARYTAVRALLGAGVATLLWWTLVLSNPDSDGTRSLNLVPFHEISRSLRSDEAGYGVVNLWGNILVFVPVGVLTVLSMRTGRRCAGTLALAAGIGLSIGIEAAQYTIGRSADVDDVILNATGILIGVVGARLTQHIGRPASMSESSR